jgi:hypothetical protein
MAPDQWAAPLSRTSAGVAGCPVTNPRIPGDDASGGQSAQQKKFPGTAVCEAVTRTAFPAVLGCR